MISEQRYDRYRPPTDLFGRESGDGPPMRLVFVIGSTDISGGTYVILQHVLEAENRGDEVTVVPLFPPSSESTRWHPVYERLRLATLDDIAGEEFDVAVATWWRTVYELDRVRARHYAYFVQSIESRFHDASETKVRRLADATYDLGLPVITETPWIRWYLGLEHGRPAIVVPNGIDKSLFTPIGPSLARREDGRLRVLVEGPLGVPMKNVDLTLELVARTKPDEVWLLTSTDVEDVPGVDRVLSHVPIIETASIYRSCDVLVKLSRVEGMFGSPLEMFHCGGTTVSWDVTGHEDYVKNQINGLVIRLDAVEATVDAIRYLIQQPYELRRLQRGAMETAVAWPSWPEASSRFHDALEIISRQPARDYSTVLRAAERGRALLT